MPRISGSNLAGGAACGLLWVALAATAGGAAVNPDPRSDAAFVAVADSLVEGILVAIPEVPGLALAVVADDRVVLARGYGMADPASGLPATGETVYYIASATKPFTALLAAVLHERGALDLDSPLAGHLRGSGIDPTLVAPEVTLRDLLSHTAGLRNGPVTTRLAFTGEHTPDLLWALLSATRANEAGPGVFEYTNFGYNLLTMITDRELGAPWQDLLRNEILAPAGMDHTTAYASQRRREGWPAATPWFGIHPDGMQRVALEKTDATMHSAGGVMTTARDAARWLRLQLTGGLLDGRRVLPAAAVRATQRRCVETADPGRGPFGTTAGAAGWRHGSHGGREVLHHSGGYPGFRSLIALLPDEGVGVAVFVNEGTIGSRLPDLVAPWILDRWLGADAAAVDTVIAEATGMRDRIRAAILGAERRRAERTWNLGLPADDYAGRYRSTELGTLTVARAGDGFTASLGPLVSAAEPFPQADSMRVELVPGQGEILAFAVVDGRIAGVEYEGVRFERSD